MLLLWVYVWLCVCVCVCVCVRARARVRAWVSLTPIAYNLLAFTAQILNRIGIPYDSSKPLDNASSVVYAGAVVEVEPLMADAVQLLATIQAKLQPFGDSVNACFSTVKSNLAAIGFPT